MSQKKLTVRLRSLRRGADAGAELPAVIMSPYAFGPGSFLPYTLFAGCSSTGWKHLDPVEKALYELDNGGFWRKSRAWELAIVTADTSDWWRVVPVFTSWSRKAMRQETNLLKCMPCELCWFSKRAQSYFYAVYIALAALPRDLVDAHVLSHLSSSDISGAVLASSSLPRGDRRNPPR